MVQKMLERLENLRQDTIRNMEEMTKYLGQLHELLNVPGGTRGKFHYYVFTAASIKENAEAISNARLAVAELRDIWEMNATIIGIYDGPKFIIDENDGGNFSVMAEDDSLMRLISGCMQFVRAYEHL